MRISLLTDAPKHNLALMKISAYHKDNGDDIILNAPLFPADITYASVLFEKNKKFFNANLYGGPAFDGSLPLSHEIEETYPDYNLFNLDYSLGYTYRPCSNNCYFCKVPKMNHSDTNHHSIFEFHNPEFDKICLLNNNTFQDPQWKETFEEIWDANLKVIDENGYDLRLLEEEKAMAIKKTNWVGKVHFAWDRMRDESLILQGLNLLKKYKIRSMVYVLIGYNTTFEQDIYRCQKIIDAGQDPYIMPFNQTKQEKAFKRFIGTFMWRKYKTIKEAWKYYW